MTKDQKNVLKALDIFKDAKLKSDNKHTKWISPQISVPVSLPRKINNPKFYIKQYAQFKVS